MTLSGTYKLCEGCNRQTGIDSGCTVYEHPEFQHTRIGGCAMDTRKENIIISEFKLNPLKASKRQGR